MREHDGEPVRGLPERLPDGERILWQGAPSWMGVARQIFWIRPVAIYFGLLGAWFAMGAAERGADALGMLGAAASIVPAAAIALGLLALLAWVTAKTTIYTITNRRVTLRIGVALQLIVNLPFKQIVSADLKPLPNGRGEIAIQLHEDCQFAYLMIWPHARPWRFSRTEPSLRAIPDAAKVAGILGEALLAAHPEGQTRAVTVAPTSTVAPEPGGDLAPAQ